MSADDVCQEVTHAFHREVIKREIHHCQDIEALRQMTIAMVKANDSMRAMLTKMMREQLGH